MNEEFIKELEKLLTKYDYNSSDIRRLNALKLLSFWVRDEIGQAYRDANEGWH